MGRPHPLEARLAFETRIGKGDEGITVEGALEGSSFYGLIDASAEIMKLVFASSRQNWSLREREGSTKWVPGHGTYLRASRRIAAVGEETKEGYVSPGIQPLEPDDWIPIPEDPSPGDANLVADEVAAKCVNLL